jgi:D-alanyl-D-alanine carboxypeptidase
VVFKPVINRIIPLGLAVSLGLTSLLGAFVAAPAHAATPVPIATPTPGASTPIVCGINCPYPYDYDTAASPQVVVNKTRPLNPLTYKPVLDKWLPLAVPAAAGYREVKKAMATAGAGTLCLNSGYRSFATQTSTYNRDLSRYGKAVAENLAAHPGYSEHQTGLAIDVSTTALGCKITNFGGTKASNWLAANVYKYGFIIRYPQGQTAYTGYQYEPWHIRFVGIDISVAMHNAGESVLEKYFGLPAAPKYLN